MAFRNQLMEERSRQYNTLKQIEDISKRLEFLKGDNMAVCGRYFKASYIPKPHDRQALSRHATSLASLKEVLVKIKEELVNFDQSLFNKSGRRLSSAREIHHAYNVSTEDKIREIDHDIPKSSTKQD